MVRGIRIADERPIDDEALRRGAGPLDEAYRDASGRAGADRIEHLRIRHGRRIAFALQLKFRSVDAAGNVGREHEQEIGVFGPRRRQRRHGEEER